MNPVSTPIELDAAARSLERDLLRASRSVRQQARSIEHFIDATRRLPPQWTRSYYLPLVPRLLLLVRHPYLVGCPPSFWRTCLSFLLGPDAAEALRVAPDSQAALRIAWSRAIRDHAQVGALRELQALFKDAGLTTSGPSAEQWLSISSAGASEYDRFLVWARIVGLDESIAPLVEGARKSWDAFRNQTGVVSVVLLENDTVIPEAAGIILGLSVTAVRGAAPHFHFSNGLDFEGGVTHEQLGRAQRLAAELAASRLKASKPFVIQYGFRDAGPVFAGASLGLAAAIGAVAAVSHELNSSLRWTCPPTTALIGSIEENGVVHPGPWSVLELKLRACFFSPLEAVIIPAAHRERAQSLLNSLKISYPDRTLKIHGVLNVENCFRYSDAVHAVHRSDLDRIKTALSTNRVPALVVLLAIIASIAGYFAYKAWYDYPNLEKTLGIRFGKNAVVFNPKDSLEWCFRDDTIVVKPVAPFGDLETGDGYSRHFWIWNMTPRDKEVLLSVEGPDSADWYINWNGGEQSLPSGGSLRMSVMYAPLTDGRKKRAALVIRSAGSRDELYRLAFTGAAGDPLPGGYALLLDGEDDFLSFGEQSVVSSSDELTFECMVRLISDKPGILLYSGDNPPDGGVTVAHRIFIEPARVFLRIGNFIRDIPLSGRNRLLPGEWHHVALSYSASEGRVLFLVDGNPVLDSAVEFNAGGPGKPRTTIGAYNDGNHPAHQHLHAEIDEVHLWRIFRSANAIRAGLARKTVGTETGLAGLWDFDADCETTSFNANPRTHNPQLHGRPILRRSSALRSHSGNMPACRAVPGPPGRGALELQTGCYLHYPRNPLQRRSDATFGLWHRHNGDARHILFSFANSNREIIVSPGRAIVLGTGIAYAQPDTGWHYWCVRSFSTGSTDMFIDGKRIASIPEAMAPVDRGYRFEGMQAGFFNDKYNSLENFETFRPALAVKRAISDLAVWDRALSDREVLELARGSDPPARSLVLRAPLDAAQAEGGNFPLTAGAGWMHVRRVRGYGDE